MADKARDKDVPGRVRRALRPLGQIGRPVDDEAPAGGLECPKCGCRHLYVRDTDRLAGRVRRYRVCRHCGHVVTTEEHRIGTRQDQ
ncbi:MAG TPA: hypothetical protein VMW52_07325 [Phycisphaerae bacterium]|nr:hypothetical protein [Phycisphaerae bacterium]